MRATKDKPWLLIRESDGHLLARGTKVRHVLAHARARHMSGVYAVLRWGPGKNSLGRYYLYGRRANFGGGESSP